MTTSRPAAWALYDGTCGVCSRGATRWERVLAKRGIGIARLEERWVSGRLEEKGIPPEQQARDFRILVEGAGGALLSGADAYRWAFRRIWWMRPLWLFSILPGFRLLFDAGYRTFARNRHRVSQACRLEPPR